VIKRLWARGHVRREVGAQDRRCIYAILTDAGWEKVVVAAPGHVDALRTLGLEPLDSDQINALANVGDRLRTRAQSHAGPNAAH
jgi:DNA-binding MarR family transcriptional regulator